MELSQQLEFELSRIVDELDIPAVELLEGLVDIATSGNWHELEVFIGRENPQPPRNQNQGADELDPRPRCRSGRRRKPE